MKIPTPLPILLLVATTTLSAQITVTSATFPATRPLDVVSIIHLLAIVVGAGLQHSAPN